MKLPLNFVLKPALPLHTAKMIPNRAELYTELARVSTLPLHPLEALVSDLPTGYQLPLGVKGNLPFVVERTRFGNVPVYTKPEAFNKRGLCEVRKVIGDQEAFRYEMQRITPNDFVYQHIGSFHVKGKHRDRLLLWLLALGF
eukprot:TRINITY_DN4358_c0_g1_i1.p1 TRINITY_DN4358_c0_g1~~TRINITY_DN4358_c0_g1_i1.p1  ORF type:complete len:156 (+),score=21.54 TRINITY_DN4358_c0_g1_i1:44-469(+)